MRREPTVQQYRRGDLVYVKKITDSSRDHFACDQFAVVLYSYDDQYGGGIVNDYSVIFVQDGSSSSWYIAEDFIFICYVGECAIEILRNKTILSSPCNEFTSFGEFQKFIKSQAAILNIPYNERSYE